MTLLFAGLLIGFAIGLSIAYARARIQPRTPDYQVAQVMTLLALHGNDQSDDALNVN